MRFKPATPNADIRIGYEPEENLVDRLRLIRWFLVYLVGSQILPVQQTSGGGRQRYHCASAGRYGPVSQQGRESILPDRAISGRGGTTRTTARAGQPRRVSQEPSGPHPDIALPAFGSGHLRHRRTCRHLDEQSKLGRVRAGVGVRAAGAEPKAGEHAGGRGKSGRARWG